MANRIDPMRKVTRWEVGDANARSVWVGADRSRDTRESWPLELIRVSAVLPEGAVTNEAFEAVVSVVDYGGVLGPIDLPFSLVVPGVTDIIVRPVSPVTHAVDIASRSVLIEDRSDRNFATRTQLGKIGDTFPIPQWVRGVGVYDPARFVFLDRAGFVLTDPLDGAHDRPSGAVFARLTVAGLLIFFY